MSCHKKCKNIYHKPNDSRIPRTSTERERSPTPIRRTSTNFVFRLSELKPVIERYLQNHPEHRRTAGGWFVVHELASVREPASEVTTRIQGNADGSPSRNTI